MEDSLKWNRIIELHHNWDNLTNDEIKELIDLKNSLDKIEEVDFKGFEKMSENKFRGGSYYGLMSKEELLKEAIDNERI